MVSIRQAFSLFYYELPVLCASYLYWYLYLTHTHTHTHTATCVHIPIHFHIQLFVVWLVRFHRKTWTSNDTNKNIMCAVHGVQLFLLSNKSNSGFRECFFVVMKRPNSCTVQYTRYRTLKTAHCTVTTFLSSTCKNDRMRLPECQTICDFA